jgi:hypothetical protein
LIRITFAVALCGLLAAVPNAQALAQVELAATRTSAQVSGREQGRLDSLLTVLVTWLSVNFELPAIYELPRIEIMPPAKMLEIRYSRFTQSSPTGAAASIGRSSFAELGHDVFAIYDDVVRTIYLPEGWTGRSAAEVSVLVHELVHHLQNVGGLKYDCAGAREKPAYRAQSRWLELFDKNIADEFDLDPMTVLVRTNCMR